MWLWNRHVQVYWNTLFILRVIALTFTSSAAACLSSAGCRASFNLSPFIVCSLSTSFLLLPYMPSVMHYSYVSLPLPLSPLPSSLPLFPPSLRSLLSLVRLGWRISAVSSRLWWKGYTDVPDSGALYKCSLIIPWRSRHTDGLQFITSNWPSFKYMCVSHVAFTLTLWHIFSNHIFDSPAVLWSCLSLWSRFFLCLQPVLLSLPLSKPQRKQIMSGAFHLQLTLCDPPVSLTSL